MSTLNELDPAQEKIFAAPQPEPARLAGLASAVMAGGVVSGWQRYLRWWRGINIDFAFKEIPPE